MTRFPYGNFKATCVDFKWKQKRLITSSYKRSSILSNGRKTKREEISTKMGILPQELASSKSTVFESTLFKHLGWFISNSHPNSFLPINASNKAKKKEAQTRFVINESFCPISFVNGNYKKWKFCNYSLILLWCNLLLLRHAFFN